EPALSNQFFTRRSPTSARPQCWWSKRCQFKITTKGDRTWVLGLFRRHDQEPLAIPRNGKPVSAGDSLGNSDGKQAVRSAGRTIGQDIGCHNRFICAVENFAAVATPL